MLRSSQQRQCFTTGQLAVPMLRRISWRQCYKVASRDNATEQLVETMLRRSMWRQCYGAANGANATEKVVEPMLWSSMQRQCYRASSGANATEQLVELLVLSFSADHLLVSRGKRVSQRVVHELLRLAGRYPELMNNILGDCQRIEGTRVSILPSKKFRRNSDLTEFILRNTEFRRNSVKIPYRRTIEFRKINVIQQLNSGGIPLDIHSSRDNTRATLEQNRIFQSYVNLITESMSDN